MALWLVLSLAACSPSPSPTPPPVTTVAPSPVPTVLPTATPAPYSELGSVIRDIPFCAHPGVRFDVYMPNQPQGQPAPALLYLHMGGGDKREVRSAQVAEALARGYVVVASNFREPPFFQLPLAVHDVKCAVRRLRAQPAAYGLDPDRIGVWGCSVGGWLAALLGVTDAGANLEGDGGYSEQSSQVQAVAMFDGVAELGTYFAEAQEDGLAFLGIEAWDDPRVAQFSPVTYASAGDPPFLLLASSADAVWRGQAERLQASLAAAGVPAELASVPGTHCWPTLGDDEQAALAERLLDFFDAQLR